MIVGGRAANGADPAAEAKEGKEEVAVDEDAADGLPRGGKAC